MSLIPIQDAMTHTGLSEYMVRTHGPDPVRIGGRTYWRVDDLDAWIGQGNDVPRRRDILGEVSGLSAHEIR